MDIDLHMGLLTGRLESCSVTEGRCAAEELGIIGRSAASAVPDLIWLLSDDNITVVRAAAVALGAVGDPTAFAPLMKASNEHPDGGVRRLAREAPLGLDPPGY